MSLVRLVIGTFLFVTFSAIGSLRADIAPFPSECDDMADGERCVLFNGTAGLCKTHEGRGRKWHTCEKDDKECDRLRVGAPCHGYLREPAHCQAFTLDNRNWRACVVDEKPKNLPASDQDGQFSSKWPMGGLVGAFAGAVAFVVLATALNRRKQGKKQ